MTATRMSSNSYAGGGGGGGRTTMMSIIDDDVAEVRVGSGGASMSRGGAAEDFTVPETALQLKKVHPGMLSGQQEETATHATATIHKSTPDITTTTTTMITAPIALKKSGTIVMHSKDERQDLSIVRKRTESTISTFTDEEEDDDDRELIRIMKHREAQLLQLQQQQIDEEEELLEEEDEEEEEGPLELVALDPTTTTTSSQDEVPDEALPTPTGSPLPSDVFSNLAVALLGNDACMEFWNYVLQGSKEKNSSASASPKGGESIWSRRKRMAESASACVEARRRAFLYSSSRLMQQQQLQQQGVSSDASVCTHSSNRSHGSSKVGERFPCRSSSGIDERTRRREQRKQCTTEPKAPQQQQEHPEREMYSYYPVLGIPKSVNGASSPFPYRPVLNPSMMEALRPHLPASVQHDNFWLKYSLQRGDGASLWCLWNKIRYSARTLFAIETMAGDVFGCYVSTPWRHDVSGYFGSGEAFLWRVTDQLDDFLNSKSVIEVFHWTGMNRNVQRMILSPTSSHFCDTHLMVGGSRTRSSAGSWGGGAGLILGSVLATGYSDPCPITFGLKEPLCHRNNPDGRFDIANLEVWTLTSADTEVHATQMEQQESSNMFRYLEEEEARREQHRRHLSFVQQQQQRRHHQ